MSVMAQTAERPSLRPRKMNFPFADHETPPPRYWMAGSRLVTHMSNGINLLFPKGERFFIRSVQAFVDELDDPELVAQVCGFMAQEVRHRMEHESFFALLEEQGYDVQSILDWYDRLAYLLMEPRTSPELRLAAWTICAPTSTPTSTTTTRWPGDTSTESDGWTAEPTAGPSRHGLLSRSATDSVVP